MNHDISNIALTHSFTEQKYLLTKYLFEKSVQLKWSDSESPEKWNCEWLTSTIFKIYGKTNFLEVSADLK